MGMMTRSRRKSDEIFGFFINLFFSFWLVIPFWHFVFFFFPLVFYFSLVFTAKASGLL